MPNTVRFIMRQLVTITASFALSQIQSFGAYSPFGVALVAGVPKDCILAAAVGSCFGYIVTPAEIAPMRYIAAVISAAVISHSVRLLARKMSSPQYAAPFTVFGCLLVTGLAVIIPDKPVYTDILLCIAESLLGGGAAYFFSRTLSFSHRNISLNGLNSQELSCIVVTVSIMMMSFTEFSIGEFVPIRILGVFLILLCARFGHESAGCIVGITAGVALGLPDKASFLIGAYGFGGLLAGVFAPLGQFGCAAAFAAANAVATLLTENAGDAVYILIETAVATIIFTAIPSKYLNGVERFFRPAEAVTQTAEITASTKLHAACETMNQVSKSVSVVSESLNRMQSPRPELIYDRVREQVCEDCVNNKLCWENKNNTDCIMNAFHAFERLLREGEFPTDENIPQGFAEQCARLPLVIGAFQQEFVSYEVHMGAIARLSEMRSVVSDQFSEMAQMLDDLARGFDENVTYDRSSARQIESLCPAYGFEVRNVNCIIDSKKRYRVELTGKFFGSRTNRAEWAREMSKITGRKLSMPEVTQCGDFVAVTFREMSKFTVHSGGAQYACVGKSLCGDAFETFGDGAGKEMLLISDGMGTGGRAAIDAALAAGLFSRMTRSSFMPDTSLRVVNSALLTKSGDESFATLDVVSIDLYTGEADFYKAGAASSFVRKKGVSRAVEIPSTPPGIFRQVEFKRFSMQLGDGDIVLLVSDGVISGDTSWILEELNNCPPDKTAQELADEIAAEARRNCKDGHDDDITVVAARIEKTE